ncbi:MAG: DUF1800 family protein, partial [Pseudomonadota bacterium]
MLRAVEQHPAMLIYLENRASAGANSRVGQRRKRGLNENLAREILELHTVTEASGYGQADVTALANLITGWTIARDRAGVDRGGRFQFNPRVHASGAFEVLGKTYRSGSERAGEAVLDDLARHPNTAEHLARKLVSHFVGGNAAPELVARLAKTFADTDGDLAAVTRALVEDRSAWEHPAQKVTPPYDFLLALQHGLGVFPKAKLTVRLTRSLGQPIWSPPSPKGWPDDDMTWAGPAALRERLRIASRAARQAQRRGRTDARAIADELFGPALTAPTRLAVARAETATQAFELLLMSPEFLRR